MEPEKPFACTLPDCGMTFTNEDHLHVHTKKHDMVLQLGMEQKAAFVADQTPTPTRFIRNCEEVGLFQDLQSVNPFDEGFKRAMETKHSILPLDGSSGEDALHTPHLVFPESGDCTLYTNNQKNITISRSSSDESGAVKEYETTTISKLTNEVTISRIVKDIPDRNDDEKSRPKDRVNETVSYKNNVIKIHSNVERRKENNVICADNIIIPPIMSQKSLDFVVDSLTCDAHDEKDGKNAKNNDESSVLIEIKTEDLKDKSKIDDYEVTIKLPNGKRVKMKAMEDDKVQANTKEKLKKVIKTKYEKVSNNTNAPVTPVVQNIMPIAAGTLIPVTLVRPTVPIQNLMKIPIAPLPMVKNDLKIDKRKKMIDNSDNNNKNGSRPNLDSRSAASKRYRDKLKEAMRIQNEDNKRLRELNEGLNAEIAILKLIITKHLKKCPIGDDLRDIQDKLHHASQCLEEGREAT